LLAGGRLSEVSQLNSTKRGKRWASRERGFLSNYNYYDEVVEVSHCRKGTLPSTLAKSSYVLHYMLTPFRLRLQVEAILLKNSEPTNV
jgi:hypothetical protein